MRELVSKGASVLAPGVLWPGKHAGKTAALAEYDPVSNVVALVGYKVRMRCPSCGGVATSMLRPELFGIVPWRWPWPRRGPLAAASRGRGYVKAWFLSVAPLARAGVDPAVAYTARLFPCSCFPERGRTSFLVLAARGAGVEKRGVSLAAYLAECRRAWRAVPGLASLRRVEPVG